MAEYGLPADPRSASKEAGAELSGPFCWEDLIDFHGSVSGGYSAVGSTGLSGSHGILIGFDGGVSGGYSAVGSTGPPGSHGTLQAVEVPLQNYSVADYIGCHELAWHTSVPGSVPVLPPIQVEHLGPESGSYNPVSDFHPMVESTGFHAPMIDNVHSTGLLNGVIMPNHQPPVPNQSAPQVLVDQTERTGNWNPEEHRNFLLGLKEYPWGSWALIAENYVRTRSPSQICSHAQKYQKHYYACIQQAPQAQKRSGISINDATLVDERGAPIQQVLRKRRGISIHDTKLVDEHGNELPLPHPPHPL